MIIRSLKLAGAILLGATLAGQAFSFTTESLVDEVKINHEQFVDALSGGEVTLDLRVRHEDVSQDLGVLDRGGQATTLRTRLRYETGQYNLFSAAIGFQDNRAIPDDSSYYSLANNELDDAVVQDPESTDLNEGWVSYDIINTLFKYGRQPISWDNQRFVGNENWRQLGQSFSGLTVRNEFLNYTRFKFAKIHRVEGVLGDKVEGGQQSVDATLFNVQYRGILNSLLSIYSYDVDNEGSNDVWDSSTIGIRFSGEIKNEPSIHYAAEYAKQKSKYDNPVDYSTAYQLIELGLTYWGVHLLYGAETLGADGSGYFVVPLGSKHEFQGFSDVFNNGGLGNIAGGIKDRYFKLGYIHSEDLSIIATYHDFESDDSSVGPGDLGSEFDIEAKYDFGAYSFSMKYSDYQADSYSQDIEKTWVNIELNF